MIFLSDKFSAETAGPLVEVGPRKSRCPGSVAMPVVDER